MKPGFEELDHFITSKTPPIAIQKIMIFINNIDIGRKIAIYLQGQFSAMLYNKSNIVIEIFSINLTVKFKTQFLVDFCYSNICI